MRRTLKKASQLIQTTAALYRELVLSALRLVPGRSLEAG